MNEEDRKLLRELLDHHRVISLSILVESRPYAGLLPYVVLSDYSAALVHASALARHTKGLKQGAPFAGVIHFPDRLDADPLRLPRLMLEGEVDLIDKETKAYEEGKALYLARFPQSAQTFALGDFNLYRLGFARGRMVAGFARASTITPEILGSLAED